MLESIGYVFKSKSCVQEKTEGTGFEPATPHGATAFKAASSPPGPLPGMGMLIGYNTWTLPGSTCFLASVAIWG